MGDPSWPFWQYVVTMPVVAGVAFFVLRWAFDRFPSRTRRELTDLQRRVQTLESVVDHVVRARARQSDLTDSAAK